MKGERAEQLLLGGLLVVGLAQMVRHPRRTLRMLSGGSWFE